MESTAVSHQETGGKGATSFGFLTLKPLTQRLKVELTVQTVSVSAILTSAAEVDKLIKILEANKAMLPEEGGEL